MYFRPEAVTLDEDGQVLVVEGKEEEQRELTTTIHAACFRGRGLMAGQKRKLPQNVMGTVLLPPGSSSSSSSQTKLRTGEVFHDVLEWEHEWNEQKLSRATATATRTQRKKMEEKEGSDEGDDTEVDVVNDVNSESSVEKALALIQLLRSVHDPLPLET